jgi:hypothetical protein
MLKLIQKHSKEVADDFNRVKSYVNKLEKDLPTYKKEEDGSMTVTIAGIEYTLAKK